MAQEPEVTTQQLIEKIEALPERIRPRDRGILDLVAERLGSLDYENNELQERIDQIGKSPTEQVTVYPHGLKIGNADAPLPRFQFRWHKDPKRESSWLCYYEFCWALEAADIRNEWGHGEARVILGCTRVGTDRPAFMDQLESATPFRDGAHAIWDATAFGNPPTYIVAPDGRVAKREPTDPAPSNKPGATS